MRVSDDFVRGLDEWRRMQNDLPVRAEAVRQLVSSGMWSIELAGILVGGGLIEVSSEGDAREAIVLRRADGKVITFIAGEFSTSFPRFVFEGLKERGLIAKDEGLSEPEGKIVYRAASPLKRPA